MTRSPGSPLPTVAAIKRAVADDYGIALADLEGLSHLQTLARPRQVAMTLCVLLTSHSGARIGTFFDRDPTTVLYARRAVEKRRRSDPALHNAMRRITLELLRP